MTSVLDTLDRLARAELLKFSEKDHPRGPDGRWIATGSALNTKLPGMGKPLGKLSPKERDLILSLAPASATKSDDERILDYFKQTAYSNLNAEHAELRRVGGASDPRGLARRSAAIESAYANARNVDNDALQAHLVDYKGAEGRDLTGPGTSNIRDVAGGAGTTRYVDVPGLDALHKAMGYTARNPVSTSTDMDDYVARRNKTFKAQKVEAVPIRNITWTQPRVNDEKVAGLQKKMAQADWDWDKAAVFILRDGDKNYLLNGHHRVVAAAASGRGSYPAYVFTA